MMEKAPTLPTSDLKIDRNRIKQCLEAERKRFVETHPKSQELFERAKGCLLAGVPMNWMVKWAGDFPVFVKEGQGARFTDVDGHEYVDLCLGDTGAMTGHAPKPTVDALIKQASKGFTFMLPTEDTLWVAENLQKRFGLKYWQMALTATDANRFSLRLARMITGRQKVLVFNWCYHGSVDESFITLTESGPKARKGNIGPAVDPTITTKVVEFNDVAALEKALADRDVACVLTEPVMTNIGIVHPDEGFHAKLRELTRKYETLLIMDETHTICAGPGGYTALHKLEPDILTLGKPLAGGMPAAVYGFTQEVADKIGSRIAIEECDTGGIGGTLAGNCLSIALMRATLEHVLTAENYEKMIANATRFTEGVEAIIKDKKLPWIVKQLGGRAEYWFREAPPKNGSEAAAAGDFELERYMHLAALNRGVLMTPFHNMALMSPATTAQDVDKHTEVFRQSVEALL